MMAQVDGAVLAALALHLGAGDLADLGTTAPAGALAVSMGTEAVLTFFLMFVITSVATDGRKVGQMAGLDIGGTVCMGALMGGPISGASMNPPRSLGSALISGSLDHLWIYLFMPVVGAVAGARTYAWIQSCQDEPRDGATGCC